MGLKFSNFELQMLYVMNCKKINKCMGHQQCNRHLHFPGLHYSFQGVFQTFPYLGSLSRLFKALKISTLNSRTFRTFPGSVRTLSQRMLKGKLLSLTLQVWSRNTKTDVNKCQQNVITSMVYQSSIMHSGIPTYIHQNSTMLKKT